MITTSTPRWQEQFERVQRYQLRIAELAKGRPFDRPAAWFRDDIFTFFVECHSFKDWLVNDSAFLSSKRTKEKDTLVTKHIEQSDVLQVCADIANGKKHYTLTPCRKHADRLGWTDGKPQLYCWIEVSTFDNREEPLVLPPLLYTSDVIGRFKKETGRDMTEDDFETRCYQREQSNLQEADRLRIRWREKQIVEFDHEVQLQMVADVRHKTQVEDRERTMEFEAGGDIGVSALALECIAAWEMFLRENGESQR